MIESIENAIQLVVVSLCLIFSGYETYRLRNRAWGILSLFYAGMFLGDLFWQLYLIFYQDTPGFYVSEISWFAAYLFLILLLYQVQSEEERRVKRLFFWLVPVFVTGMCIFFMQEGDYLGNLISAFLMGMMIWRSLQGLCCKGAAGRENRALYLLLLAFCFTEYALWTSSCFWIGDTFANPYFWFDALLTLCIGLFVPVLRRTVTE